MTPAFAALILGGMLLLGGWQGRGLLDVFQQNPDQTLPLDTAGSSGAAGAGASGTDSTAPVNGDPIAKIVAECDRIAALRLTYVWGGGHAGYPANGPFDCSGAVSYVLHAAGLLKGPPRVSGLLALWGKPGPGKRLTVYANAGHVFIVVDGKTWQTSHQNPGGGPGWTSARSSAGFTARHYPGL